MCVTHIVYSNIYERIMKVTITCKLQSKFRPVVLLAKESMKTFKYTPLTNEVYIDDYCLGGANTANGYFDLVNINTQTFWLKNISAIQESENRAIVTVTPNKEYELQLTGEGNCYITDTLKLFESAFIHRTVTDL